MPKRSEVEFTSTQTLDLNVRRKMGGVHVASFVCHRIECAGFIQRRTNPKNRAGGPLFNFEDLHGSLRKASRIKSTGCVGRRPERHNVAFIVFVDKWSFP